MTPLDTRLPTEPMIPNADVVVVVAAAARDPSDSVASSDDATTTVQQPTESIERDIPVESDQVITVQKIEIVSNSDRSNGPNGESGSEGSTDHEIVPVELRSLATTVHRPDVVTTNQDGINTTSVTISQTSRCTTSSSMKQKSPNRYSRMKNEISNHTKQQYPSRNKSSNNNNHHRNSHNTQVNNNNNNRTKQQQQQRSSTAAVKTVPANGQPCIIHTPTLDELQSMTFTEFIRTEVLPAAMTVSTVRDYDSDSDDEDDDDDDDNNNNNNNNNNNIDDTAPLGGTGIEIPQPPETVVVAAAAAADSATPPRNARSRARSTTHNSTTPTRRSGAATTKTTTSRSRTTRRCGDNTALLLSTAEPMVLREGIAKIRLPKGFFTTAPYGDDRTGRGPLWDKGTSLGDKVFNNPIQQHIRGMTGIYEYTHTMLHATTLAEFRDRADKYRLDQMGSVLLEFKKEEDTGNDTSDNKNANNNRITENGATITNLEPTKEYDSNCDVGELTPEQVTQLERQFWRRLSPTMPPAVYGADEPGTFFGDDAATGWSLAKLDSCLHVLSDIPGVTSPYLYAGMWASVFCAHTEDMNLLSINYLHAGQPKLWYAVAEHDAARFVSLAEHHFVHQLQNCKEFLRHKRCLLSPLVLQQAGIRYQTAIQYPGDVMVTFPGGYHFGFNAGFNVAEATNFGVLEWLPFGRKAKICLCRPDSVRIDMNRLTYLLQRYQVDVKRNKRLTWKEWRKRYERKEGITTETKSEVIETEDEIIEVISYAPKKRQRKNKADSQMSEQERKNEFWIEVTLPSQLRKTNVPTKKGSKKSKIAEMKPWYLAKPVGRKRLEMNTKVLCLVPAVPTSASLLDFTTQRSDVGDDGDDDDDDDRKYPNDTSTTVEDYCFTGTIVRIEDKHALIHFDGQCKSDDIWLPLSSPKIFLNGGIWVENNSDVVATTMTTTYTKMNSDAITTIPSKDPVAIGTTATTIMVQSPSNVSTGTATTSKKNGNPTTTSTVLPVLHYWKEMDTNVLLL